MKKINKDTFFWSYIAVWLVVGLLVVWNKWFDPQWVNAAFILVLACLIPVKHKLFIE